MEWKKVAAEFAGNDLSYMSGDECKMFYGGLKEQYGVTEGRMS